MGQVRWPGVGFFCAVLLAGCVGGSGEGGLGKAGGGASADACLASDGLGGARVADPCPTTARFTVGGTITGLAGTVILDNLGLDTLPLGTPGAFAFTVPVADGTPYRITVSSQPVAAGVACYVTHGEGTVVGAAVTDVAVVCAPGDASDVLPPAVVRASVSFGDAVGAFYPHAPQWNQYVRNDGTGPFDATGTACDGTEPGEYGTCVHGGEARAFTVPGLTSCDGISARDELGAFDWACDATGGAVRMVTSALRQGLHLSDLIDFDAADWRFDALHVSDAAGDLYVTPPARWWGNPLYVANGGGELDLSGAIYLVTEDTYARFLVRTDHVGLVVKPGVTLHGAGVGGSVVAVRDANFLWVEGRIDASGLADAIRADRTQLSVFDGVEAQRAGHAGLFLNDARANRVSHFKGVQNDAYGIRADAALGNVFAHLLVAGNALSGLHLNAGADNRMVDVTASGNGNWGIAVRSSWDNVLADVTAANQQAYGVWLDHAPGTSLMNIAATNNGGAGLYLHASSGTTLINAASTDNGDTGIALSESSGNHVTGALVIGGNIWACTEQGGIRPGLTNISCAGRDGSDPVLTTTVTFDPEDGTDPIVSPVTLGTAFQGLVFADDPVHPRDASGAVVAAGMDDWLSFANPYRHFGRNGVVLPDPADRGRCVTGVCRIWDWTLLPDDTLVRHRLLQPDGTLAFTHFFADATVAVYVPNAVELMGDGAGNENVLCEAGETCVYTPNLASDQGSDPLVDAGSIGTGGAVEGVTLLSHGVIPPPEPPAEGETGI